MAAAARPFTVEKDKENFTGHVTVGRVKRLRRPGAVAVARVASAMAEKFFGERTVNQVEIIRSELSPKGALHTTIGVAPFSMAGEKGTSDRTFRA